MRAQSTRLPALFLCGLCACGKGPGFPGYGLPLPGALDGGDAGSSDPGSSDAGGPNAADAGTPDAGTPDAGGAGDAGPGDAGPSDAGPRDAGTTDAGDAGSTDSGIATAGPLIDGCPVFPPSSEWNRDVSADPVDPGSDHYLALMNASTTFVHPDFGSTPGYGVPYATVPGSQPTTPMSFLYAGQSDPGPYPFPQTLIIQSGPDLHAVVIDRDRCLLYETYDTHHDGNGGFSCGSGARFDLRTGALRPDGWTSATASGLPIFPGLVRYDEAVQAGEIHHALIYTSGVTSHFYLHPATHEVGNSTDPAAPPMGLRLRLRKSYDLSRFTGVSRTVVLALQRYGMLLIDNGSDFTIGGASDSRWPDSDLEQLKSIPGTAFEAVQVGAFHAGLL